VYLAHAFGQRYDLPIPLALFVVGGAAVVVVSFLLVFRRSVDAERLVAADTVPPAPLRPVRAAVSLLVLAFVVVVGLLGKQELPENVDPTLFWIVVWIVVPLSCGLLGDWTRTVNPFAVLARLSSRTARAGRHGTTFLSSLAGLLPSLVPIAFGYLIAHYCSYVVTNLQLLFPLIGNPGFTGWPITLPFPFSDSYEVHLTLLPPSFYWYLSLAAIVLAHVAAVLLAHRHLGTRTADEQQARASEYPWLVAMVLYTVFSLFLIAQTEATETAAPEKPAAVASSRTG